MRDSVVGGLIRTLSFPVAIAIVLAAACTQTAPRQGPNTATQRAMQAATLAGGLGSAGGREAAEAVTVAQGEIVQAQVRPAPECSAPVECTTSSS